MDNLPKDSVMLLSVVNTNLRDYYSSLDEFCYAKGVDRKELENKLGLINYKYNSETNQFV